MTALFDLSDKYEALLQQGLDLSGEKPDFFIAGRLQDLVAHLPKGWTPNRILDYGCGIGRTANQLSTLFPGATVFGVDTSTSALDRARTQFGSARVTFAHLDALPGAGRFDLCYVNGVFHHILPERWATAAAQLYECLGNGGYLALFENNPWNPGARWVMKRIPFDKDAVMLSPHRAHRLIRDAGFEQVVTTRYLFYFPRWLSVLRGSEGALARVPLGAQYYLLAKRAA